MMIEAGKQYKTRDGRLAFVAAIDDEMSPGEQVIGWVDRSSVAWARDGSYFADQVAHDLDLIVECGQPRRIQGWIAVNPREVFSSREEAVKFASDHKQPICACILVNVPDGDGL
jgi:hypothetical protein